MGLSPEWGVCQSPSEDDNYTWRWRQEPRNICSWPTGARAPAHSELLQVVILTEAPTQSIGLRLVCRGEGLSDVFGTKECLDSASVMIFHVIGVKWAGIAL